MVHYAGEDGIDTGAFTKEYLSENISNISSCAFFEGSPIDSMLFVQNGYFRICGEITNASLVSGDHRHVFLKKMFTKCSVIPILWICRISVWENIWRAKIWKKWKIWKTALPNTENTLSKTFTQASSCRQIYMIQLAQFDSAL